MLQLDWLMARLRPIAVSSGSTEMQFDCTETIAAAFADGGIDDDSTPADLPACHAYGDGAFRRRRSARNTIADAPFDLAALAHDGVEFVAMRDFRARRDLRRRISIGRFRHQIDVADTFGMQLERNLLRRQFAIDMLTAGHCRRVVVENFVGDIGAGTRSTGGSPACRNENTCRHRDWRRCASHR